jgi:hypothetical protein
MCPKRKLCEYMSALDLVEKKRNTSVVEVNILSSRSRSVACQTNNETMYTDIQVVEIIRQTRNEMISKYYKFIQSTNSVETFSHLSHCEL